MEIEYVFPASYLFPSPTLQTFAIADISNRQFLIFIVNIFFFAILIRTTQCRLSLKVTKLIKMKTNKNTTTTKMMNKNQMTEKKQFLITNQYNACIYFCTVII